MIIRDVITSQKPSNKTPVWFMRQAGRYLPEYQAVRKEFPNFIEFCQTPDAAATVTIQPLKRFDLDAAIIFSDILIVPFAMGCKVEFLKDHGPHLGKFDINQLRGVNIDVFKRTAEAIKLSKIEMKRKFPNKGLIGFAGAPWTVAAYMVQGSGSKDFSEVIKFIYQQTEVFDELIDLVTKATTEHLSYQIEAGADVVKLFDSWAGLMPASLLEKYCIAPIKKIVGELKVKYPNVPIIGFPRGANTILEEYTMITKVDCVAVDQRICLSKAAKAIKVALQGNFDNILLADGDHKQIEAEANAMLKKAEGKPYIFNLGHGILPSTPIANIEKLISCIRKYESSRA